MTGLYTFTHSFQYCQLLETAVMEIVVVVVVVVVAVMVVDVTIDFFNGSLISCFCGWIPRPWLSAIQPNPTTNFNTVKFVDIYLKHLMSVCWDYNSYFVLLYFIFYYNLYHTNLGH